MSRILRVLLPIAAMLVTLLPTGLTNPAYAAGCQGLPASALRYGAPHLVGTLAPEATTCYTLPERPGTTLNVSLVSNEPDVTVQDSEGNTICGPEQGGSLCRLTGPAPYVMQVHEMYGESTPYDIEAFRVTGDTGCPARSLATFGASNHRVTGTARVGGSICATFPAVRGSMLLDARNGSYATWTLLDADGTPICGTVFGEDTTVCEVPPGQQTTFLMTGFNTEFGQPTYDVAAFDLAATAGCGPAVSVSWRAPVATVPTNGLAQQDCRPLSDAQDGDRLAVANESRFGSINEGAILIDADGSVACSPQQGELGCTARGSAPFRLVSYENPTNSQASYHVAVRKVGPTSDCPTLARSPFGLRGSATDVGVGCRQVDVTAGHPFTAESVRGESNYAVDQRVYDEDFTAVCTEAFDARSPCTLPTDRHLTLITGLLGSDSRTTLYDYASSEGCTTPALGLGGHRTSMHAGGTYCESLDVPSGTSILTVQAEPPGVALPYVSYVDESGSPVCAGLDVLRGCTATGTGPFRLLFTHADTGSYTSTTMRTDQVGHCATLGLGIHSGATVNFTSSEAARCLHVDPSSRQPHEVVYARTSVGTETFMATTPNGETCRVDSVRPWAAARGCEPDETTGAYDVIVRSTGPSTVHVKRAPYTGTVVNLRLPLVLGVLQVGHTVRAVPGDWSSDPYSGYTYEWLLSGKPVSGAHLATFRIPAAAAGRSLSVRIGNDPQRGIAPSSALSVAGAVTR